MRTGMKRYCRFYDHCLIDISTKKRNTWGSSKEVDYVRDYLPRLGEAPMNVATKLGLLEPALGINVPSTTVHTDLSFGFLRHEDQLLDCLYLVHAGSENFQKIVIAIPRSDRSKCMRMVAEEIQYLRESRAAQRSVLGEKSCSQPLQHRNISVSTEWLDRKGISYTVIRLLPGELLYIGPGVLYQEINIGFSIVESVDVGGSLWNLISHDFEKCSCGFGENTHIQPNTRVNYHLVPYLSNKLECSVPGCEHEFLDPEALEVHMQSHESADEKKRGVFCDICHKVYANRRSLRTHKRDIHGPPRAWILCECGKEYHPNSISGHRRICDSRKKHIGLEG